MEFNKFVALYDNLALGNDAYLKMHSINDEKLISKRHIGNHTIEKVTEMIVTRYKGYKEQKSYQYKVAHGEINPNPNHWLYRANWSKEHDGVFEYNGKTYASLYHFDDNTSDKGEKVVVANTTYYLDGVEVTEEFLRQNELIKKSSSSSFDFMTITIDKILEFSYR